VVCTRRADRGLDRSSVWWSGQGDISKGYATSPATKSEAMQPKEQHKSRAGRQGFTSGGMRTAAASWQATQTEVGWQQPGYSGQLSGSHCVSVAQEAGGAWWWKWTDGSQKVRMS